MEPFLVGCQVRMNASHGSIIEYVETQTSRPYELIVLHFLLGDVVALAKVITIKARVLDFT